jgi:prepilin-type N-terminal cleavage/methylation domain-containing protein
VPARGGDGFTLVELLVSLTVLAIAFLGALAMFPLGSATVTESGLRTTAAELAQQGFEELLDLPYTDQQLNPGYVHVDSLEVGDKKYYREWDVEANTPISGCKMIRYTVAWHEAAGRQELTVVGVIASTGRS